MTATVLLTVPVSVGHAVACLLNPFFVSQLSEARDKTLEGVNRTVDYKELEGKDPSTGELVEKLEQVHDTTRCLMCVCTCRGGAFTLLQSRYLLHELWFYFQNFYILFFIFLLHKFMNKGHN